MADQLLVEDWGYPSDHDGYTPIVESKIHDGDLYIEGIFMQADVTNGNGRMYPKKILEKAVNKYLREQVKTGQALGELNHPQRPNPDPDSAAIRITDLWFEGSNVMGKAIVLKTTQGNKVRALMEGGWVPGVSSRGLGSVKNIRGINEVQDGFRLTVGVDVVWGPSAPNAYVKPMQESSDSINEKHTCDTESAFNELAERMKQML